MKKLSKRESREKIRKEKEIKKIALQINYKIKKARKADVKLNKEISGLLKDYGKGGYVKKSNIRSYEKALQEYKVALSSKQYTEFNEKKYNDEILRRLNKHFDGKLSLEDVNDFIESFKSGNVWSRLKDYGFDSSTIADMMVEVGNKSLSNYLEEFEMNLGSLGEEFDVDVFRSEISKMRRK